MYKKCGLREKSNSTRLCFKSSNDALDHARHTVQESRDWLIRNDLNVIKAYIESSAELVLDVSTLFSRAKYHLVFRPIPFKWDGWRKSWIPMGSNDPKLKSCRGNPLVLANSSELVKCPQKVIPSLIRLEPFKKRYDFFTETPTSASCPSSPIALIPTKRKAHFIQVGGITLNPNWVNGKVKSGTHVFYCVSGNIAKGNRKRSPFRAEFVNFVNSIRIFMDDMTIGISIDESIKTSFKIFDVRFCASEPLSCTIKRISRRIRHDGKETISANSQRRRNPHPERGRLLQESKPVVQLRVTRVRRSRNFHLVQ
jgi:hypothetical protein